MKRTIILIFALFLLSGCASNSPGNTPAESDAPPSTSDSSMQASGQSNEPEPSATAPAIDLDAYKDLVLDFQSRIVETSIILGNMGKYESNFMEALGRPSDDMVERAFSWLGEKSEYTQTDVEAMDAALLQTFTEIVSATEGDEANAIFAQVNSLYSNYTALYSVVTTVPLSVSGFSAELSEYFSAVSADSDALTAMLG